MSNLQKTPSQTNEATAPIRVLLVDNEDIVRYGLKSILQSEPSIEVVGEAVNGQQSLEQAQHLQPDVVIMDIKMPVMDGVTATSEICQRLPDVKILILTTSVDDEPLYEAIRQGAIGYILKDVSPEDFIHTIQGVYRGYMQLDPAIGRKLYQQPRLNRAARQSMRMKESLKGVTPREKQVLQLIGTGANNREISHQLNIAEKTVKNHVSSILNRLCLRDRTQLAIWVNTNRIADCVTGCLEMQDSVSFL